MAMIIGIIGTDTEAGKTVVTGGLLRALRREGVRVAAVKPVQTGCLVAASGGWLAPDVAVWKEACPEAPGAALCGLPDACSPHLAARLAGVRLAAAPLCAQISAAAAAAAITLLEGAGGLLTPLNERETLADICARLCAGILLVVPNRLGAVNHALLTLEALQARRVPVLGVISNAPRPEADRAGLGRVIRSDNPKIITRLGQTPCLAGLPYLAGLAGAGQPDRDSAWEAVCTALAPVARLLLEKCREGDSRQDAQAPKGDL